MPPSRQLGIKELAMPTDGDSSREREWSDSNLLSYDRPALIAFLSGNPSPAWEWTVYCSEENLPRLIDAAIVAVYSEEEEFSLELLLAIMDGLCYRYKDRNCSLPESLGLAFIRSLKGSLKLKDVV